MHMEFKVKGANVALGPGKSYCVLSPFRGSLALTYKPQQSELPGESRPTVVYGRVSR